MTEHQAYGSPDAAVPSEVAPETRRVRRSIAPAVVMWLAVFVAIVFAIGAVVLTGPGSPLTRGLPAQLPPAVENASDFSHPDYVESMECSEDVRPIYGDDEIVVWAGTQQGEFGSADAGEERVCVAVDILDPAQPARAWVATSPDSFNVSGVSLGISTIGEFSVLPGNAPATGQDYGGMDALNEHVLFAQQGADCDARVRIPTVGGIGSVELRPMCGN